MYSLVWMENINEFPELEIMLPEKVNAVEFDDNFQIINELSLEIKSAEDFIKFIDSLVHNQEQLYLFVNKDDKHVFYSMYKKLKGKKLGKTGIVIRCFTNLSLWEEFENLTDEHIGTLPFVVKAYYDEQLLKKRNHILCCDSYIYIGDKSAGVYHEKNCDLIENIKTSDLHGCGRKPEKSGFKPCSKCIKIKPDVSKLNVPTFTKKTPEMNLVDVLKEQIKWVCSQLGFYVKFKDRFAYITTMAGEWVFEITARPIKLYHKNNVSWEGMVSEYHLQPIHLNTPISVLTYIYRHDNCEISRQFKKFGLEYEPFMGEEPETVI